MTVRCTRGARGFGASLKDDLLRIGTYESSERVFSIRGWDRVLAAGGHDSAGYGFAGEAVWIVDEVVGHLVDHD